MTRCTVSGRKIVTALVIVAFSIRSAIPVYAVSAVKLQNFIGNVDFSDDGVSTFTLEGTASHLGRFTCDGEVEFVPGEEEGSLVGRGVAVFKAANGDLLVGVVSWDIDAEGGDFRGTQIHFSWKDFIQLADGTIVHSTGRFETERPPGLVVIAIIAILIGLLLPAVQKVR